MEIGDQGADKGVAASPTSMKKSDSSDITDMEANGVPPVNREEDK